MLKFITNSIGYATALFVLIVIICLFAIPPVIVQIKYGVGWQLALTVIVCISLCGGVINAIGEWANKEDNK